MRPADDAQVTATPPDDPGPKAAAHTALEQQVRRLADAVEQLPVGVVIWEPDEAGDLRLAAANAAAERLTERELRAMVGRSVTEVFPGAEQARIGRIRDVARGGAATGPTETRYRDAALDERVFHTRILPLPDGAAAVLLEDRTEIARHEDTRRQLLHRLVEVSDTERRQLGGRIHDGPLQSVVAAQHRVRLVADHVAAPGSRHLEALREALAVAVDQMRHLVVQYSPPGLADPAELRAAIEDIAPRVLERYGASATVEGDVPPDLPRELADSIYWIVVQALANVAQHAHAHAVRVVLTATEQGIEAEIVDDGIGMPPGDLEGPGHLGVRAMRERAEAHGGTCSVGPTLGGRGARVHVRIPIA